MNNEPFNENDAKRINDFLDKFEWDEEDESTVALIRRIASAQFIFYAKCSNENCLHQECGFCNSRTSCVMRVYKRGEPDTSNAPYYLNQLNKNVPIKTIARSILRDYKKLLELYNALREESLRMRDFINKESFLSYKSNLASALEENKKLKKQLEELNK